MNSELIKKCDLLVANRNILRETLTWESDLMALAGSSYYVGLGIKADADKFKNSNEILKAKAGMFSNYRGNVRIPLLCRMSVSESPEKYLEAIRSIVDSMKDLKWINKDYKTIAAITIYDHVHQNGEQDAVEKMVDLYKGMEENHPWLTSSQDVPFAAILAVSEADTNALLREMENCYQILKEFFSDQNAVQSLSQVLAIDIGNTVAKCNKLKQAWNLLKEKKHKYGTGYELALLGMLCLLDIPIEKAVEEIIEADEYLKGHKGFGNLSLGKKTRLMYAVLMVINAHTLPTARTHENILVSVYAIAVAIELSMLLIVSTTTATN